MISTSRHLRISSLTTSHTLGFSLLWASLMSLDSSFKKMRWVHNEGSNPLKFARVQPIACSFHRNTLSNHLSFSWSSWDEMITGFAYCVSRKVYFSVDGRVLSSNVGLSNGSSSKFTSSLIAMTSSVQASISWSSQRSMSPTSSEAREGYFINFLMSTFTICSPTFYITSPFPQSMMAFVVAKKCCPRMIGVWLSSLVIFISMTRKSTRK